MWQSSRMNSCEFPLDPCRADHRVIIWEAYDDYGQARTLFMAEILLRRRVYDRVREGVGSN